MSPGQFCICLGINKLAEGRPCKIHHSQLPPPLPEISAEIWDLARKCGTSLGCFSFQHQWHFISETLYIMMYTHAQSTHVQNTQAHPMETIQENNFSEQIGSWEEDRVILSHPGTFRTDSSITCPERRGQVSVTACTMGALRRKADQRAQKALGQPSHL